MKKYKRFKEEDNIEFYLHITEFVGANIPLELEKYKQEITKRSKIYNEVYRVWNQYTIDYYKSQNEKIIIKNNYISTTLDIKAIDEMAEEAGSDDGCLVSVHNGKGFDPIKILQEALKYQTGEENFIKQTIMLNKYQKEIVLWNFNKQLSIHNVIGYIEDGRVKIIND